MEAICAAAQALGDPMNTEVIERAVRYLLEGLGEDAQRDGLRDTPKRVARAYHEMTSGYRDRPERLLATTFDVSYDEMVILKNVHFVSLCEHHLLPFTGEAHVGYMPGKKVVGLSKMARLVHCFARRLQVQERMTQQIAETMMEHLKPRGVAVILKAHHSCMSCRGVKQESAKMVTSAMLGSMRDAAQRAEFLQLIGA